MEKQEKDNLREKIHQQLQKFQEEIVRLEEMTKPISPENSIGRVSRMDAIQNKSVAEASLRSARKRVASLKMALLKLEEEGFGKCSRCGNPIQPARLIFMPESTRCVRCAE
jgi:DnaK suppressor protein